MSPVEIIGALAGVALIGAIAVIFVWADNKAVGWRGDACLKAALERSTLDTEEWKVAAESWKKRAEEFQAVAEQHARELANTKKLLDDVGREARIEREAADVWRGRFEEAQREAQTEREAAAYAWQTTQAAVAKAKAVVATALETIDRVCAEVASLKPRPKKPDPKPHVLVPASL